MTEKEKTMKIKDKKTIVSSALMVVSHILAQKYNDEILKITDGPKNKEESKTDDSENK